LNPFSLHQIHAPPSSRSATISWPCTRKLSPPTFLLRQPPRASSNIHDDFYNSNIKASPLHSASTMAVLDGLPGVEVTVIVDGEDLHEYWDADMEDEEDTVTKYIEAVDGAHFAVKIKVTEDATFKGDTLAFKIKVDGSMIRQPLIEPMKGRRLTEHGYGLPEDLERAKNLGKIEISLCHQKLLKRIQATYGKPDTGNGNFISEKAIKGQGMTHSYSLTDKTYQVDDTSKWRTKIVTGTKNPAATFVFHYRSKAALRDLMIIPRTP
ncbi:hypothetical protein KCU71_g14049, partial [Aureobasidium melanogenum]